MPNGALEVLSTDECGALLRSVRFGRVVYTDRALPACTPVNYAMDGPTIVFRTTAGSRLALATEDSVIAFEVDRIDELTESGWTIVATGMASPITGAAELLRAEQLGLTPWVAGRRKHWVRLTPGIITGRRLSPAATG